MTRWLRANRGFLVFLVCFGCLRTAVADWNPVPTGSMRPTILEGDVVFVDRVAYDLKLPLTDVVVASFGDPARGDIVTFASPKNGQRLVKRIVAIPGDSVEMRAGVLLINDVAATYRDARTVIEPLARGEAQAVRAIESVAGSERAVQSFPELWGRRDVERRVVPPGSYYMLGDNRDNSEDSRYIGFVSRAAIIGRARRLVVSADIDHLWLPRLERFGQPLR